MSVVRMVESVRPCHAAALRGRVSGVAENPGVGESGASGMRRVCRFEVRPFIKSIAFTTLRPDTCSSFTSSSSRPTTKLPASPELPVQQSTSIDFRRAEYHTRPLDGDDGGDDDGCGDACGDACDAGPLSGRCSPVRTSLTCNRSALPRPVPASSPVSPLRTTSNSVHTQGHSQKARTCVCGI